MDDLIDIGLLMEFKSKGMNELQNASNLLMGFGKAALAVAGIAIGAFAGLAAQSVTSVVETSHQLGLLSQRFGTSVTNISRWIEAGKLLGVSQDVITNAFQRMSTRMGQLELAFKAHGKLPANLAIQFKELGVALVDNHGHFRDLNEIMLDTMDRLGKMTDVNERNRISQMLLGGSSRDLIQLYSQGRSGIEALMNRAQQLGAVYTDGDVVAAKKFQKAQFDLQVAMEALHKHIGEAFLPMAVQLITFFDTKAVPVLVKLATWFQTHIPAAIETVKKFLNDLQRNPIVQWIEEKLFGVLKQAPIVFGMVQDAVESLTKFIGYLGQNINSLQTYAQTAGIAMLAFKAALVVPSVINGIAMAMNALGTAMAFVSLAFEVTSVSEALALIGMLPFIAIAAVIAIAVGAMAYLVITHWTQIKAVAGTVWTFVTTTIKNFVNTVRSLFTGFVAFIGNAWKEFSKHPIYYVGYVVGWVIEKWVMFNNWLTQKTKELIQGIGDWFGKLPGRLAGTLVSVTAAAAIWISDLNTNFNKWINDTIAKITGWFGHADWAQIGKNIVTGIWSGVQAMGGWLKDRFNDFLHGLIQGAKDANKSNSPSKLWADEVGKGIPQGIAVGVKSEMGSLQGVLNQAVQPRGLGSSTTSSGPTGNNDQIAKLNQMIELLQHQVGWLAAIAKKDLTPAVQDAYRAEWGASRL